MSGTNLKLKPGSTDITRKQAPKAIKNTKGLSSKETQCARKITVHIANEANKEKMKTLPIKDLVEALQVDTNSIKGVSRLISGNIKIHTESLEAKKLFRNRQIEPARWPIQPKYKYKHSQFKLIASKWKT